MAAAPRAAGGGLGDLLGGLLGGGAAGGTSGARSGGNAGMAILATIAMAALKNWTDNRRAQAAMAPDAAGFAAPELEAMTAPATEELVVRAMISRGQGRRRGRARTRSSASSAVWAPTA